MGCRGRARSAQFANRPTAQLANRLFHSRVSNLLPFPPPTPQHAQSPTKEHARIAQEAKAAKLEERKSQVRGHPPSFSAFGCLAWQMEELELLATAALHGPQQRVSACPIRALKFYCRTPPSPHETCRPSSTLLQDYKSFELLGRVQLELLGPAPLLQRSLPDATRFLPGHPE